MRKSLFITSFIFLLISCSKTKLENPFPFLLSSYGNEYSVVASIETDTLLSVYYPLFEKYGYVGNGVCWEGHIIQILEKEDVGLLDEIEFDPEAGAFHARFDSEDSQLRFVNVLSPIFSNLERLEKYVKAADPKRIDD